MNIEKQPAPPDANSRRSSSAPGRRSIERSILKSRPQKRRSDTKQDRVIALLSRPAGTTIAAITKTTGWQQHSIRGFFAGVIRKRLGLKLVSDEGNSGRIYRIISGPRPKKKSSRKKGG